MKFSEAAASYLRDVEVRQSLSTYKKLKGYLKRTNQFIGDMDCDAIDKQTLNDFILYRREQSPEVSNTTLNTYILYIQVVLREEADIILPFKKLRQEKKLPQILSDYTIRKVFKYCDEVGTPEGKRNKLMFMMLLDTGVRISELLSLEVENVDFINNIIRVEKTKTRVHRQVLMTEKTKDELLNFISINDIQEHIFINLKTRQVLHDDSIQTICQRIQEKLNLKQSITPHKWRHTFASRFIDSDGNQFVLMKLLGHSKITTTQIYVQVSMKKEKNEYLRIFENGVK